MKKKSESDVTKMKFVPVCPDCGARMTKGLYEDEEGEPVYMWICACEPDPYADDPEEDEEWLL